MALFQLRPVIFHPPAEETVKTVLLYVLYLAGIFGAAGLAAGFLESVFWSLCAHEPGGIRRRFTFFSSAAGCFLLFFLPAGFLANALILPGKMSPVSLAADLAIFSAFAGLSFLIFKILQKYKIPSGFVLGSALIAGVAFWVLQIQSRTIYGISYRDFGEQASFFVFSWGISLAFVFLLSLGTAARAGWRPGKKKIFPFLMMSASLLFLAGLLYTDFNFFPDLYPEIHCWLKFLIYFAFVLIFIWTQQAFPGRIEPEIRVFSSRYTVLFLVLAFAAVLFGFNPQGAAESYFLSPPSTYRAALLKVFRKVLDFDRDGFSFVLGGGDADDRNPAIHPLAHEKTGNGIDEDGYGGDLTAARIDSFLKNTGPLWQPRKPAVQSSPKYPVILMTADTLPVGNLSVYGYKRDTTPNLKAFAGESVLFENAVSQANHTVLSFYSILRGRYPVHISRKGLLYRVSEKSLLLPKVPKNQRNQILGVSNTFKDDPNPSLADVLAANGYVTIAYPNDRYSNYLSEVIGVRKGFQINFTNNPNDKSKKDKRFNDAKMADAAIGFIKQYKDRPFFLWLHFYDHHSFESGKNDQWGNTPVDRYDNGIRRMDGEIGRVLAALKAEGLYDRSLIAFTADHGCVFMLHKEMHGTDINEPQVHVPMIVHVPGAEKGRRLSAPAGGIDLMPTFLDYAGIEVPSSVEGWSLRPLLEGKTQTMNRYLFTEGWRQEVDGFPYIDKKAVVYQNRVLIYDRLMNSFKMEDTAHSWKPVAAAREPELFERLRKDLKSWIEYQERES